MAENQKASEDKVHLKNFKDSSERSKDIVTRLYKNEICHSVQQTRKAEWDKEQKENCTYKPKLEEKRPNIQRENSK